MHTLPPFTLTLSPFKSGTFKLPRNSFFPTGLFPLAKSTEQNHVSVCTIFSLSDKTQFLLVGSFRSFFFTSFSRSYFIRRSLQSLTSGLISGPTNHLQQYLEMPYSVWRLRAIPLQACWRYLEFSTPDLLSCLKWFHRFVTSADVQIVVLSKVPE